MSNGSPAQFAMDPERARSRESFETEDGSVAQAAHNTLASAQVLIERVDGALRAQTENNPYAALALAAGAGFVLGGGLASPVGRMLLRASARALAPQLLDAWLSGFMPSEVTAPPGNNGSH